MSHPHSPSKATLILILVAFFTSMSLMAVQAQTLHPVPPPGSHPVSNLDVKLLATSDDSTLRLLVLWRSCNDFFSFSADALRPSGSAYLAPYSLSIDVYDTTGVIRHSAYLADTLRCGNYDLTHSRNDDVQRVYSVILPKTVYVAKIEIEQREGVLQRLRTKALDLSILESQKFCPSPVFLSSKNGQRSMSISQSGFDFGCDSVQMVFSKPEVRSNESWSCRIIRKVTFDDWYADAIKEQRSNAIVNANSVLRPRSLRRYSDDVAFVSEVSDSIASGTITCSIDATVLAPGTYQLTMTKDGGRDTIVYSFDIQWQTIPLCLKTTSTAMSAMRFVLSDKEFDQISQGSEAQIRRKLVSWWKKKDPTPSTLYNEAMLAYFRRVDESRGMFVSAAESDGLRSERAKVYVLYGMPTSIEQFSPSNAAPREVWTYANKVRHRITFERDSRDIYRVVRDEKL